MEAWIDEAENRGCEEGRREGIIEGENRLAKLMSLWLRDGKSAEIQEILANENIRNDFYLQYGIWW